MVLLLTGCANWILDRTLTRQERRRAEPRQRLNVRNLLIVLVIGALGCGAFRAAHVLAPPGYEHDANAVGLAFTAGVMIVAALICAILSDRD